MKHSTKTLLCVLCAAAAALCVIFAIFMLTKKQSASSASSAAASSSAASSAPAVSEYGTVDSFDYQNFTYSDGLDANGYRTGITAQDYVTLPDNVAALPIKKADVTPSDSDVQARIDSLLSQYSTTQAVTDRAAQNGDVVNIDYSGHRGRCGVQRRHLPGLRPHAGRGTSSPASRIRSSATTLATPLM